MEGLLSTELTIGIYQLLRERQYPSVKQLLKKSKLLELHLYRLWALFSKGFKEQQERDISTKWNSITNNNYDDFKREEQYKIIQSKSEQDRLQTYLKSQIEDYKNKQHIVKKQEQNEHQIVLDQLKVMEIQNKQFYLKKKSLFAENQRDNLKLIKQKKEDNAYERHHSQSVDLDNTLKHQYKSK